MFFFLRSVSSFRNTPLLFEITKLNDLANMINDLKWHGSWRRRSQFHLYSSMEENEASFSPSRGRFLRRSRFQLILIFIIYFMPAQRGTSVSATSFPIEKCVSRASWPESLSVKDVKWQRGGKRNPPYSFCVSSLERNISHQATAWLHYKYSDGVMISTCIKRLVFHCLLWAHKKVMCNFHFY